MFEPIAIVGRGAIFPGAFSPQDLWSLVVEGRYAVSACPEGRWRIPKDVMMDPARTAERVLTDQGGYVNGFEDIFDPDGFLIGVEEISRYDEMVQWMLHTARGALREGGMEFAPARTGAVIGLLGLPSDKLAQFAEEVWLGQDPEIAPENRFMCGFAAQTVARALGLDQGAFALDAACASSLYAIKFACDALHDRRADAMLAGAVNRADDLFLHTGFSTLKAMSPSGQTRPFHAGADGLIPAEGAAFVFLKRLADAEAAGDKIIGVIRGVGVSNDGRTAGLLTPSEAGQEQAIRMAYEVSGLKPSDVTMVECHATGTPVGDASEIRSTGKVFAGLSGVAIGSVKSNIGHPITAAGMASLLKVLGAMEAGIRPATLHLDQPTQAIEGSPFRLLTANEPWTGERRAAISAFGFGGNNAHMIVEQHASAKATANAAALKPVAIVAMGVVAGDATNARQFAEAILAGEPRETRIDVASLEMQGLGFPPADLEQTLPQQLVALQAAAEAIGNAGPLNKAKTGVFVGMGCDAEVARYGLRWRAQQWTDETVQDTVAPVLTPPAVVGRLANIVANRISSKFDLRGPSLAVMSEELSGIDALRLAQRAVANGELDAAIVGAVDLSVELVHIAAIASLLPHRKAGDAAVFLVLKRAEDAGEPLALLGGDEGGFGLQPGVRAHVFGHAHAASGLLDVAAELVAISHGTLFTAAITTTNALGGRSESTALFASKKTQAVVSSPAPRIYQEGPLAIVAATEEELASKRERALQAMGKGGTSLAMDGIYYRKEPIAGELAFVFPGAAAAYSRMGRDFFLAFPELLSEVPPELLEASQWLFDPFAEEPTTTEKLWGSSLLSQVHARLTLGRLELKPTAAIGISSGETNSLAAFGAWRDIGRFHHEFTAAEVFERYIGGQFETTNGVMWQTWRLNTSEEELRTLLASAPLLRLTAIHCPGDYVVAGPADAMPKGKGQRINYDLVVHCPEFAPFAKTWHGLHSRETTPVVGVRFYTHSTNTHYQPTRDKIADALTNQAQHTLDFPAVIERAYADGVRIFLEHGPQGGSTSWIRRILGDRDHIAISLDLASVDGIRQALNAQAQLLAAGVKFTPLQPPGPKQESVSRRLVFPAHAPPFELPAPPTTLMPSRTKSLFELHAHTLTEQHQRFLEMASEHNRKFLEMSERAYAAVAAGGAPTATAFAPAAPIMAPPPPPPPPAAMPVIRKSAPVATKPAAKTQPPIAPVISTGRTFPPANSKTLSRTELEQISSGPISAIFGPQFANIDQYHRVVRMPMPPLLLADRMTGIDGAPCSMGLGTIWTETDVKSDSWYLWRNRMPGGIMIEAGQADLLLISWLGIDQLVKGERAYRLLGCDLTYHGGLPQPGETLQYEIAIDQHARQGDIRLFFFHYDCHINNKVRLSVRNGQAGFFTAKELADSAGILWAPDKADPTPGVQVANPRVAGISSSFTHDKVRAAAAGKAFECFGKGFEFAAPHQRSPGFGSPDLLLFDNVTDLDFTGGPWKRGYMRAELPIRDDNWFFEGHFKNDPCMPGTLMFEGCLQAMAFYMMALGFTTDKDGWRFEPVPEIAYPLRCRGQVIPSSRNLVYELFVDEVIDGPEPRLFVDLLCTIDGLKAFHCKRMGLALTPGCPLDEMPVPDAKLDGDRAVATVNNVPLNYLALLNCAWGPPSHAFGTPFTKFDSGMRLPRLPGPPYHFMTRIAKIDGDFNVERIGCSVEAEYDIDPSDWYFHANSQPTMPYPVLLEAALQPCGWLGSYIGIALRAETELAFRNLDGTASMLVNVPASKGTIRTKSILTNVSRAGGMTLVSFDVVCHLNAEKVFEMKTTFGFFRAEALARQVGIPASPDEKARVNAASDFLVDLKASPDRYFADALKMPTGNALLIDRINGMWPAEDGTVRLRAEKDVNPGEWFFKAHFYQDPVQPGSLGLEALVQTLQFYAIHMGAAEGLKRPMVSLENPHEWKYRGQVVPSNRKIVSEVEVKQVVREGGAVTFKAEGWLWVDGTRIYWMSFGLRVAEG